MKQTCKVCSNIFNCPPSRIKLGKGQFCTRNCRRIGMKGRSLSPQSQFKKGMATWNKGKPMSEESKEKLRESLKRIMPTKKRYSHWRGRNLPFEIRKKMSEAGKIRWFGHEDKRKESKKIRDSFEYQEWRKAVFKRDDFTCVICKKTNCYLEADHIKPFARFPELRFSIENGRTLCIECHRKTETWGHHKK